MGEGIAVGEEKKMKVHGKRKAERIASRTGKKYIFLGYKHYKSKGGGIGMYYICHWIISTRDCKNPGLVSASGPKLKKTWIRSGPKTHMNLFRKNFF